MSSGTGQRFSLEEIRCATKDFDDDLFIGQGGFGKVYKGQLSTEEGGHVVAIKRLSSMSTQGEPEFKAEIETLSELRHCHLVSLVGYCDENKEMILVYEYMPNGTLYHHLHKSKTILDWVQRMKIAIGAGRGLDYLHTGVATDQGIIHRDVKSSNILLDKNLEAKISDFGLSKIGPTSQSSSWVDASVKGTFGYLDPEYFYTKKLSRKTDVYAFGVVLFELLSGRLAVDEHRGDEQCSLVRWAKKCVKERKLDQIVDSSIKGTIFPKGLKRFAQIADRCVHGIPKERPTMTEVVTSLKAILELQLKSDNPTKPSGIMGFTWKTKKSLAAVTIQNSDQSSTSSSTNPGKEFTYDELKHATRNFKGTCLWMGVGTEVYKGWVDKQTYSPCNKRSGLPVTVKVFHYYRKHSHFDQEIFKECSHPNLVKFIGYCINDEQLLLVYEFLRKENLEDLLRSGAIARLPLVKKVQIAFGVARGIHFLQKMHHYFGKYRGHEPLFGRHSIMLDEDFNAKFSYYGVTYISSQSSPGEESEQRRQRHTDKMKFRVERKLLPMELSGFTVIFEEVVGGRILNKCELDTIDDKWQATARLCYESCYGVESESKVLETLEEYAKYIPPCQEETLEDATFYSATLDELQDETFSTSFESC